MAARTVLIPAAGESERWHGECPKQLVDIAGEPLLKRTLRQLEALGQSATVVTHKSEIEAAARDCHRPQERRWLAETVLSTHRLWGDRTVILLGDVVWADEALRHIVTADCSPRVYGNYNEIYAIAFDRGDWERVVQALKRAKEDAEAGGRGKLWQFYRALCGCANLHKHHWDYDIFEVVPSDGTPNKAAFTQDFDTLEGYHHFLDRWPWARGELMRNDENRTKV